MQLHTLDGARKYLTAGERAAFLHAAEHADRQARTLCMTLAYAGCRLSEALALTADRVDLAAGVLVHLAGIGDSVWRVSANRVVFAAVPLKMTSRRCGRQV